jgi:pimeloyl-ACP methyl ester carboxylesterase
MAIFPLAERALRRALNVAGIESRWVRTKVAEQHVYDARGTGELPAVVLLHGIGAAASAFAPLIQKLRPRVRRVIAPEAPGHGLSGIPARPLTPETLFVAMSEVLDGMLDEPAIVFGNSLGGAVALSYGMARPERSRGLFLASPAGAFMDAEELDAFLRLFHLRSPADGRAFLKRIYHRAPWFAPLLAGEVHRLFARDVIQDFTRSVRPQHLFTREQLRALSVPVHLLWGRSERLMPAAHLAFFKRSLPDHATIEEPEGLGHCAHLDDAGVMADKIARFAERVATAPRARRCA